MFMVGGRLYSFSDKSQSATLVRTFDPTAAWKQLGEDSGLSEEDVDRLELEDECFWSYFNPSASLICFYAAKEYIIVYDVNTGNIRWCHKLKGGSTSDYWHSKPIFHPKLPMMAWVGQFGKDGREDFDSLTHCGVYLVDLSTPDATPERVTGLEGKVIHFESTIYLSVLTRQQLIVAPTSSSPPAAPSSTAVSLAATTTTSMNENSSSSKLTSPPTPSNRYAPSKP